MGGAAGRREHAASLECSRPGHARGSLTKYRIHQLSLSVQTWTGSLVLSLPARKSSAAYLSAPSALPPHDPCDLEKQPDGRPSVRRRPASTSRLGRNCPPSRGRGSLRVTAPQKLPGFGEAGNEDTAGLPQTWEAIEASPSMIPVPHGPGAVPSGEQRPRAAASGAGGLRGRRLRVQRAQITWGLVAEDCPCNSSPGH